MFDFSEKSQIVLKDLGWFIERRVNVDAWMNKLQSDGYKAFDVAREILEHLGGLDSSSASGLTKSPLSLADNTQIIFALHPAFDFIADKTPDSDKDSAIFWNEHSFIRQNNLNIFPIGSIRGITTLFVLSDGRIAEGFFYAPPNYNGENEASLKLIGDTIADAINELTERCVAYL